jgi:hypothetical protein
MFHRGSISSALMLGALVLLAGGPAGGYRTAARTDLSRSRIGRCHMDSCWWFSMRTRSLVRRDGSGALYRVSWRGGESGHPGGHYPNSSHGVRIVWERALRQGFVFCSRRLPTWISLVGGRLEPGVLSFPPAGYQEAAVNMYATICHPGADAESPGFARRFGYRFRVDSPIIQLQRPEDIFRYARSGGAER